MLFLIIDLCLVCLILSLLFLFAQNLVFLAASACTGRPRGGVRARLRRMLGLLLFFAALALLKAVWAGAFRPDAGKLLSGGEREDILARRAYLARNVAGPGFGLERMAPIYVSSARKEWAIATLSMTTAAFTNIAMTFPETTAMPAISDISI